MERERERERQQDHEKNNHATRTHTLSHMNKVLTVGTATRSVLLRKNSFIFASSST